MGMQFEHTYNPQTLLEVFYPKSEADNSLQDSTPLGLWFRNCSPAAVGLLGRILEGGNVQKDN